MLLAYRGFDRQRNQRDDGRVTLTEAALAFAVSQIGVHEQGGNNTGPEVDLYLASVGLDPGFSWCASFVYYCFKQAAQQLALTNPCPKTGAGLRLWKLADTGWKDSNPVPGAIYVLDHGSGTSHVGLIETVDSGNVLTEISGNTNRSGSRNGDSVWRHSGPPEVSHGGVLLGYILLDRAAQAPVVNS
jgi:hypothetical protein